MYSTSKYHLEEKESKGAQEQLNEDLVFNQLTQNPEESFQLIKKQKKKD